MNNIFPMFGALLAERLVSSEFPQLVLSHLGNLEMFSFWAEIVVYCVYSQFPPSFFPPQSNTISSHVTEGFCTSYHSPLFEHPLPSLTLPHSFPTSIYSCCHATSRMSDPYSTYDLSRNPCQKLKLYFECEKLIDTDHFSLSDGFITLVGPNGVEQYTNCVQDNLNPSFSKMITVFYYPELTVQPKYTLTVYDDDDGEYIGQKREFLGFTQFTLSELMKSGCQLTKQLSKAGDLKTLMKSGAVTIRVEQEQPILASPNQVLVTVSCEGLSEKNTSLLLLKPPHPIAYHQTPPVLNDKNPKYQTFTFSLSEMFPQADLTEPTLLFQVVKVKGNNENHSLIGQVYLNLDSHGLTKATKDAPVVADLKDVNDKVINAGKTVLKIHRFETNWNDSGVSAFTNTQGFDFTVGAIFDFNREEVSKQGEKRVGKEGPQGVNVGFIHSTTRSIFEQSFTEAVDNQVYKSFKSVFEPFLQKAGLAQDPNLCTRTYQNRNKSIELAVATGLHGIREAYKTGLLQSQEPYHVYFHETLPLVLAKEFPYHYPSHPCPLIKAKASDISHPALPDIPYLFSPFVTPKAVLDARAGGAVVEYRPKFSVLFYFVTSPLAFNPPGDHQFVDIRGYPVFVIIVTLFTDDDAKCENLVSKYISPEYFEIIKVQDVLARQQDIATELWVKVQKRAMDYLASSGASRQAEEFKIFKPT